MKQFTEKRVIFKVLGNTGDKEMRLLAVLCG